MSTISENATPKSTYKISNNPNYSYKLHWFRVNLYWTDEGPITHTSVKNCLFFVLDIEKKEDLESALFPNDSDQVLSVQLLKPSAGNINWLLDRAAMS